MEVSCVKYKDIAGTDTKKDVKNLICSSIDANNNKFWRATLYECGSGSFKVHAHWGRVGDTGQEETRTFDDEASAQKFIDKKIKEKTGARKGKESYSLAAIVDTDIPLVRPDNGKTAPDIAAHARKMAKNPLCTQLVDYLVKVNVHSIVSGTTMTYNAATGMFSTPLGIVTDTAITEARDLLTQIGDFVAQMEALPVAKRAWGDGSYTGLLNKYLRLIPQKVGRKLDPATLYPNLDAVKSQNDILDSLTASLDMASKKPDTPADKPQEEENVFEVVLELMKDQAEIERLRNFFLKTLDRSHSSAHLEIANVYTIDIGPVSKAYEQKGKPVGNIMELWHGTRPGNILSIFKKGLIIPPSNAAHCTGRLFGNGVYASDISTKSLNYANPRGWGNSFGNDSVFMFVINMAMGKVYHPQYGEKLPKAGYDSTWARGDLQFPGKGAGVRHNEMIVYKTNQVNLTHLIEFKPPTGGKKATRNW
jgi:poly [ADP-ribose] polymerase